MDKQDQLTETELQTVLDAKLCPYCAEPINPEAKKCIRCGEYLENDKYGFRRKTLWDFLSLLVVPITLLMLGSLFALYQSNLEQERIAAAAELQATTEANRSNAVVLEQYINDIGEIFLSEDMESEKVRSVVRSRTVAVVNDLDSDRNSILIRFLREGGVIGWVFAGANLDGADLEDADLSSVDLSGTYLRRANLIGADLSETNLTGTNLFAANLSWADLSTSIFSGTGLVEANLFEAELSGAVLLNTYLYRADLTGAQLVGTDLSEASLSESDLSYANLLGADLSKTWLIDSKLTGSRYDATTLWPEGFDPKVAGAILEE